MIRQVCRRFHHAPRVARGADAPAFAEAGNEVVVPAATTAGAHTAAGNDAALQTLALPARIEHRLRFQRFSEHIFPAMAALILCENRSKEPGHFFYCHRQKRLPAIS